MAKMTLTISIHAPIVGCDLMSVYVIGIPFDFNPRTHRGVRPCGSVKVFSPNDFNPRTHRGVRLPLFGWLTPTSLISIHAPIVGCDCFRITNCEVGVCYFNPRTHRGVRRFKKKQNSIKSLISIHAPIVGCDCKNSKIST